MPASNNRWTARAIALLVLSTTAAVASEEERWFRVELLVFANEAAATPSGGAASRERWEPTPLPVYPGAARFLVDPELVEANLSQYRAHSEVDEFGRQILTLLPPQEDEERPGQEASEAESGIESPAALTPTQIAIATGREPAPAADGAPAPALSADMPDTIDIEEPVLLPTPFVALPSEQLEFANQAGSMQRSGRYSILFHESWLQPVGASDSALPMILDRSGDTLQWPRLQGNVRLYLSRYLHLETNLWLNTPGDYLPGSWRMPPPPLGPPSLVIEELPAPGQEAHWQDPGYPAQPAADFSPVLMAEAGSLEPSELPDTQDSTSSPETSASPESAETGFMEAPTYPYRHAVLLAQNRRMRSTEVHYIDHPLFGVIIKLVPLDSEELTALAEAEETEEPDQAL